MHLNLLQALIRLLNPVLLCNCLPCPTSAMRHQFVQESQLCLYAANILFNFGTARMLMPDSSNWTALGGTYGYIAPGIGWYEDGKIIRKHNRTTGFSKQLRF